MRQELLFNNQDNGYIPTSLVVSGASRDVIVEYNLETGNSYDYGIDDLRAMNASFVEGCVYCGSDIYNDYHNGTAHIIKYEPGGTINYLYALDSNAKALYGKPLVHPKTGEIYTADYRTDGVAKIYYKDSAGNWSVDYTANARLAKAGVWDTENGYIFYAFQGFSGDNYNARVFKKYNGTWEFVTQLDSRLRETALKLYNGYIYIGLNDGTLRKYDYDFNLIETLYTFPSHLRNLERFFDTWVVSTKDGIYILDGSSWVKIYSGVLNAGNVHSLSNMVYNGYFYFAESDTDGMIYKSDGNSYESFWTAPQIGESSLNLNYLNFI